MFFKRLNQNELTPEERIAVQVLAVFLLLSIISLFFPGAAAHAEGDCSLSDTLPDSILIVEEDAELASVQIAQDSQTIPVISSVGKKNVKINGIKSDNKLIKYTIPEQVLAADPDFLALMIEAEKYIGYPYVYGGSSPKTSFDCSGFVCWVFRQAQLCDTGRKGANGLHSLCSDIEPGDVKPGDLVFFEKTMGKDVKGITHVGIYVGNGMMIHAGDPIGFADLTSSQWKSKICCCGRLSID